MRITGFVSCLAWSLMMMATSRADLLASYDFTSGSLADSASSPLVTAGNVQTNKPYYTPSNNQLLLRNVNGSGSALYSTNLSLAISADRRISFTVSPNSVINFTNLTLNFGGTATGGRSFTANIGVFSSIDGFAVGDLLQSGSVASTANQTTPATLNLDLGALGQFQGVSTPVEFRIYYWVSGSGYNPDVNNAAIFDGARLDNIAVYGVVPEPASALLMISAAAVAALMRRRK